jgi:hypothetical protein
VLSFVKAHCVKTYLGAFAGPTCKPLQIWTSRACFFQLARDCPPREHLSGEQLVIRSEDGKSFKGRKGLLEESGTYTPQFGPSVAHICAAEFQRLRHVWMIFSQLAPAACMQCVALYMEDFCPVPVGNCCKIDFQHMTSIMCLILHFTGWGFWGGTIVLGRYSWIEHNFWHMSHLQENANSKWHARRSTCLTWGCMAMFWSKDRGSDTWHLRLLLRVDTEIVTHVLCFALARR